MHVSVDESGENGTPIRVDDVDIGSEIVDHVAERSDSFDATVSDGKRIALVARNTPESGIADYQS